jgi:hypothetical protein
MNFLQLSKEFRDWYYQWVRHSNYCETAKMDSVYFTVSRHGNKRDLPYLFYRLDNIGETDDPSYIHYRSLVFAIESIASKSQDKAKIIARLAAYYL